MGTSRRKPGRKKAGAVQEPRERNRNATSYRWDDEDRARIARLRTRYAGPTGRLPPEIDILKAALVALEEKTGEGG